MQRASKILLVLMVMTILLISCSRRQKYLLIEIPESQKVVVKEKEKALVKGEKRTFYPDPTRGYIKNSTYNVFIYVWLDPDFKGKRTGTKTAGLPDFTLPPKAIVEAIMSLGEHFVYAKGRINTVEFGWQSVGVVNKKIFVDHRVRYSGHYGWKVIFRQGDFHP